MAGTATTFPQADVGIQAAPGVLIDITADIRALVADIEVLRTGLSAAEDWILEVNTDMETRIAVSETYDAGSLVDAAGETTTTLTATGAVFGDFVQVGIGVDLVDMILTGYVQAADTVEGWLQNESGSTHDLASATIYFLVTPFATSALSGTVTAAVLSASAFDAASDMTGYDITIS